MIEVTCLFWVRELRLGDSELGSGTQVQRLGVGLRHGKLGSKLLCYCLPLFYLASIIFIPILHFSSAIFVIMIKPRFHVNISCMLT